MNAYAAGTRPVSPPRRIHDMGTIGRMEPKPRTDTRLRLLRMTASDAAVIPLALAALTSTWTGVSVASLQFVDIFLALATALALLDALTARQPLPIPWWVGVGGFTVMAVALTHVVVPTSTGYMSSRYTVLQNEKLVADDGTLDSIIIALRWCVALVILPVVTAYIARRHPRVIFLVAMAFVIGVAVSSAIAVSDWLRLTHIGPLLIGGESITGRQNGLTSHPNTLGFAGTLAVPLGMYTFSRYRIATTVALVLIAGGVFVSGSRGGQVGIVLAFVLCVALMRSARRGAVPLVVLGAAAVAILNVVAPQYLVLSESLLRFDSGTASDAGRSLVGEQATVDFQTHPVIGVGMPIITHAHSVPLQLAASGGVLLVIGIAIYWVSAAIYGFRFRRQLDGASLAAAISVSLFIVQCTIQNQLVDRFLYVPVAMIAAVVACSRTVEGRGEPTA